MAKTCQSVPIRGESFRQRTWTNTAKQRFGLALVLAISVTLFCFLPLGTVFEFGGDEGFEVIKPFMCYKGFALYKEIWSDQPPVFTVLLTMAFKIGGPTILMARLVAAGFGLVLIAAFHELVRHRSGQWPALFATFFLLASPSVLVLSVSVMQEVPAIGTGLVSAWLLFEWEKRQHWGWLLASGAAMAIALQIKLTAALVLPALLLELLLICRTTGGKSWLRDISSNCFRWGAGLTLVFALIGLTLGKGSFESSWKAHTAAQIVEGLDRPQDHRFQPRLLKTHWDCVIAAFIGIVVAVSQKRLREVAFPAVMLLTASVIHTVHRPWWDYYYLHLAIPLAWLTGWLFNAVIWQILRLRARGRIRLSSATTWKMLALCFLAALTIDRSGRRLEGIVKDLRRLPTIAANPIVNEMKKYSSRVKWIYSEPPIYAFHAQLPVRPDLAVTTLKRFWSGQITTQQIVKTCELYRVDMLVLSMGKDQTEWRNLIDRDYSRAIADRESFFCIAKRLEDGL